MRGSLIQVRLLQSKAYMSSRLLMVLIGMSRSDTAFDRVLCCNNRNNNVVKQGMSVIGN